MKKLLQNISDEGKSYIITIGVFILYYLLVFSGLISKGGIIAILFSFAAFFIVPLSVYMICELFWDQIDDYPYLKFFFMIFGFIIFTVIIINVNDSLGVFWEDENCRPSYWRVC